MSATGPARPVWIEAALNGPWGRDTQPGIPITAAEVIAEGIAAADAGAAIIHVHAYDPATGRQNDDWRVYAEIIRCISAARDVIIYPTLPLAGSPDAPRPMPPQERFAAVAKLAELGLLEWSVIDPGSASFGRLDALEHGTREGFLYQNPESHTRYGLALCAKIGAHPGFAIYEPGFLRTGTALARNLKAPQPIHRFMLSDGFGFGFPPRAYALDAYLALLEECDPGAPWMLAGLDVDILPLAGEAIRRGGHLRVGLEDARFGETRGNAELVALAAEAVRAEGHRPATAAEVRAALAAYRKPV